MIKYTKHFLKKLETLFEELGYAVRYEKGNFQSGYCLVQDRKIAVINKFFDTEARVSVLLEILEDLQEEAELPLSEKSRKLLQAIRNNETINETEEQEEPSN